MEHSSKPSPNAGFLLAMIVALMLAQILWSRMEGDIKTALRDMALFECALTKRELVIPDARTLSFSELLFFLDEAGKPFAMGSAVLLLFLAGCGFFLSPAERYRRTLSMERLLRHNVSLYPSIAPVLNWGKSLLEESLDKGPWRLAMQPLQFVACHGLLKDDRDKKPLGHDLLLTADELGNLDSPVLSGTVPCHFDRAEAQRIFCTQLGPRFHGFSRMPHYLQALVIAFMLFSMDRKREAQEILDSLSLSFRPPREARGFELSRHFPFVRFPKKGRKSYVLQARIPLSQKEIRSLWENEGIQKAVRAHNAYTNLLVLAIYACARRKGVLPTAEFLWLKPVNRGLFYLLNNYGRRTCWVEIAGAWTHYQAEEALAGVQSDFCADMLPEEEKMVQEAVNGLEKAMYDEGWISTLSEEAENRFSKG